MTARVPEVITAQVPETTSASVAAARGTAVTLLGQLIRFIVQTGSLLVLARLISPADYGLVSMVTAIVGIAAVVGDFGLSLAAMQARHLTDDQRSNLFWMNALIGLLLGIAVFFLAHPIASFYHKPDLVIIVRVLAITFVLNGLMTQFKAELARALRFGRLSAMDIAAQAVGFVVALIAAWQGAGYWALVAQQIGIAATTLCAAALLSGWRPSFPRRGAKMGSLLSFGANTMGVQAITYASSNVDNVLVGKFWGATSLGVYSRAYTIFELPVQQLAAPLTRVVLPILARVEDDDIFLRYVRRAQLMMSYGLVGSFAVAASVAQPLVVIVLGPQWGAAAPIFQVLALGGVFQALGYVYYWIFLARGKTAVQLKYSIVGRVSMIGFIYVGVHFGPIGAASGAAAGFFLLWLLYSAWGVPQAGLHVGRMNYETMRTVLVFAGIFSISQLLYASTLHSLGAWTALGAGLVIDGFAFAVAWLTIRAVRHDVSLVLRTMKLVLGRRSTGTP
jgi:O-antigen/teichoic acid export membrane protein